MTTAVRSRQPSAQPPGRALGPTPWWAALPVAGLLLADVAPAAAQDDTERRDLEIALGEQTTLPARGVASYSEGTPGIIDVRIPGSGEQFVIVAVKPGATTLLLIYENGRQVTYRVTVRDPDLLEKGVQEKDNIRLDLYFIQLAESYNRRVGVGWPTTIPTEFNFSATFDVQNTQLTNATAVVSQALPRIDLLEASGWARVQRQAALITANGTQASFSSNEQVNIVVAGGVTGELQTVSFGSNMNMQPLYDRDTGRIELKIGAEISDITTGRGTGIPGRLVSSINTRVNLEMGQSLVLGGLIADTQNAGQSGLVGLSQIPILGILFGTQDKAREYTQNVIFIVPTVVDAVSQQARSRIEEAMEIYWDYSGGLDEIQIMPTPGGLPSGAHPDSPQHLRSTSRERLRRGRSRATD